MRSALFAPLLALSLLCASPAAAQSPAPVFEAFDVAVASTADVCTRSLTQPGAYRVTVGVLETDSYLTVRVSKTVLGSTVTKAFRLGDAELVAGELNTFAFSVPTGMTANLRFETTTRVGVISVEYVGGPALFSRASTGHGGGAAGGVANPMTSDLDANEQSITDVNLVSFGGTAAADPALRRHPSTDNVLEVVGGDGSSAPTIIRGKDGGSGVAGANLYVQGGYGHGGIGAGGQIGLLGASSGGANGSVTIGAGGTPWVTVTSAGVSLDTGKAITANALHVVKVRRAAAQSMVDGSNTDISWDTEQLDTGGVSPVGAGASTTVLTTGASGEVHYVTANVGLVSAASVPSISIKLIDTDGTTTVQRGVLWFPSGATSTIFQATAVIVSTAANQTIRVHFGHDSAASINTSESISGDVSCTAVRVR